MKPEQANLNLLPSLKALLEEASVSRAAARLHVTQGAMSKNLAQLRALLCDPLLVRSGQRLVLTERAERLRREVGVALSSLETLFCSAAFDPATTNRAFTLAATDYVAQYVLPGLAAKLLGAAPSLRISAIAWEPNLLPLLSEGSIHMAATIVDSPPDWLVCRKIDEDDFVCCLRPSHPDAGLLDLASYCAAPHAAITAGGDKVRIIDTVLEKLGGRRSVQLEVPFYGPALEIVSRTDLILTLPRHIARNLCPGLGLTILELPFPSPRFEYSLIWHVRHEADEAHRWVRSLLFNEMADSMFCH